MGYTLPLQTPKTRSDVIWQNMKFDRKNVSLDLHYTKILAGI